MKSELIIILAGAAIMAWAIFLIGYFMGRGEGIKDSEQKWQDNYLK